LIKSGTTERITTALQVKPQGYRKFLKIVR